MRLSTCCTLIEIVILIIFAAALIGYLDNTKSNSEKIDNVIDSIKQTWEADFVFDLESRSASEGCSSGFENAFEYKFPGTKRFCSCREATRVKYTTDCEVTVKRRRSSYRKMRSNCEWMFSFKEQSLKKWINDGIVCKKTQEGVNYVNSIRFSNPDGGCPSGYLACGDKNRKDKTVCIKNIIKKCPITSIIQAEKNPNSVEYTEKLETKNGDPFWISRSNDTPLAIFTIQEHIPCITPDALSQTPKRSAQDASLKPKQLCKSDLRYKKIDKEWNEYNFFSENGLQVDLLSGLNMASSEFMYSRFVKKAVYLKPSCRGHISEYFKYGDMIESVISTSHSGYIYAIVLAVIFGILVLIALCSVCGKDDLFWKGRTVAAIVLMLISIIIILLIYFKVKKTEDSMEKFLNEKCSDPFTNGILEELENPLVNDGWFKSELFMLILLFIIFLIVSFLHYRDYRKKRRLRDHHRSNDPNSFQPMQDDTLFPQGDSYGDFTSYDEDGFEMFNQGRDPYNPYQGNINGFGNPPRDSFGHNPNYDFDNANGVPENQSPTTYFKRPI